MSAQLRKYGTQCTIYFPLVKASSQNFAVSGDYTHASGDVKISKDGGAAATATNSPAAITMGNGAIWSLTLTATEMQAAEIVVTIIDAATKAVEDQAIVIHTFGNASAMIVADLSAANLAANVPSAAAISSQVASDLATAHGSGSWESSGTGAGAYTRTITVNDGTTALQGAKVRLTQGAESYIGTTNASGQVVFSVDAATWSVAITKPGYTFTPTTLVVSASGSTTYSMTASGPTPSSDPDKTTVRITCYGADTEPEASATVQLRQLTAPSGDEGNAFDGAWATYTADESGIIDVTLWSDATYAIKRGTSGDAKQFTPTGATDSFASVLSR